MDIRLFETDDNDELVRRLAADELDLSFLIGPVTDERIETVELCQDPFVLVLPAETEMTAAAYPLADLAGRPMVGQQVSSCQNLIDGGLRAAGVSPNYVFRSNDNGAVQAMVRAGLGYFPARREMKRSIKRRASDSMATWTLGSTFSMPSIL